jgi:hypothetical protein
MAEGQARLENRQWLASERVQVCQANMRLNRPEGCYDA